MDLPSCPSCGQSVLDDDAEDCPFCGASMSGKPGAKPAAATSAATADSSKPKGSKTSKSKASGSDKSSTDDPFDLSSPVARKVVQLLPKPAKGKVHRIVCPMCETTGFQSKKAAGREVRCANSECLVPIFTAPSLDGDEKSEAAAAAASAVATESEPKKLSIGAYIGIAVAAALILGSGAFYFTSEPAEKELTAEEQLALKRGGAAPPVPDQVVTPVDPGSTDSVPPDQPVVDAGPKGPPIAEMRNTALRLMEHTSLQRDRNQRKPFCRRLTAEAFAIVGDFDAVAQQLRQLDKVGPQLKYYRILPLVQMAWKQLESGDTQGATASVQEALPLVSDLPAFGTLATDTLTELSTLLVAMDRAPEAVTLLNKRNDSSSLGQFLESRSRSESTGRQSFDVAVSLRPVTGWAAPQWVAVTVSLTAQGMSDKALAFAESAPDPSKVEDCLSGWAEALLIAAGDDTPLASIEQAIASLDQTGQARIHSRCVLMLHAMGKPALATGPLTKARQLLPAPGDAFSVDLQELKSGSDLRLPDGISIRRAVLAAAELAHAEAVLGHTDEAWQATLRAMVLARTMAPALPIAEQPFVEIQQRGEAAVIDELKTLRNLLTDDEARIAYQNYRNRSRQLLSAAQDRFTLQEQVLTEVLEWGLADQIWNEIQSRSSESSAGSEREPWFNTNLAKALYNSFRVSGQRDKATAVETAVTKAQLDELSSPRVVAFAQAVEKAMGPSPEIAAAVMARFLRAHNEEADKRWQQEALLRLVSRLIAADRHPDALKLIAAIQDVQTRELAYELAGQEITARGHRVAVFDFARKSDIIPPEKIALLRGFIGQLPAQ